MAIIIFECHVLVLYRSPIIGSDEAILFHESRLDVVVQESSVYDRCWGHGYEHWPYTGTPSSNDRICDTKLLSFQQRESPSPGSTLDHQIFKTMHTIPLLRGSQDLLSDSGFKLCLLDEKVLVCATDQNRIRICERCCALCPYWTGMRFRNLPSTCTSPTAHRGPGHILV